MTRLQRGNLSLFLETPSVTPDRGLYCVDQILVAERLGQKFDCSGLDRPHRHWDIAMTGKEDDRYHGVPSRELVLKVEPAQARKPDIEDDAAGPFRAAREEIGSRCEQHRSDRQCPTVRAGARLRKSEQRGRAATSRGSSRSRADRRRTWNSSCGARTRCD